MISFGGSSRFVGVVTGGGGGVVDIAVPGGVVSSCRFTRSPPYDKPAMSRAANKELPPWSKLSSSCGGNSAALAMSSVMALFRRPDGAAVEDVVEVVF
jgi:P pilus assembly chaperone PapD